MNSIIWPLLAFISLTFGTGPDLHHVEVKIEATPTPKVTKQVGFRFRTSPKPTPAKPTPKPVLASTPAPTPTPTLSPVATQAPVSDFAVEIEQEVHIRINAERTKAGLEPLGLDSRLTAIARAHSQDMADNRYFDHTNLAGCSASCRFKKADVSYHMMGENIFKMTGYNVSASEAAEVIVNGWMNSPGHRKNILTSDFSFEGIGTVVVGDAIYTTENFLKP